MKTDDFLEERRGLADLQRNALVSVFLHVLEHTVGILTPDFQSRRYL